MGLWILFVAFMGIGGIAAIIYLVTRFHKFLVIRKIPGKALSWIVAAIPVLAMMSVAFYEIYTMIVIMLHCALFFILTDIGAAIYRSSRKKKGKKVTIKVYSYQSTKYKGYSPKASKKVKIKK